MMIKVGTLIKILGKMKKISILIRFIKKDKKPFLILWKILVVYSRIPVIFIHEASHFLFIFLTGCEFQKGEWYFLSEVKTISDDGIIETNLIDYSFSVFLPGTEYLKKMIVSLAPIFGTIVYFYLIYLIPFELIGNLYIASPLAFLMLGYFILNKDSFWLSPTDKKCLEKSYKQYKDKKRINYKFSKFITKN